ncbi:uncharacterized protein [Antennarius striatus]|uniref:uncharacterized protein n=1 Tax=Antennarius striatus TaxID=241820 RepID=UPI0035B1DB9A
MDKTYISKQDGLKLFHLWLLFLAGLQLVLSADGETTELDNNDEGSSLNCTIVGPDYVTVGVPSSFGCYCSCAECTYSMSADVPSAQGQDYMLAFVLRSWKPAVTVNCTVTDSNTQGTDTITKHLQVLAGPANVTISGPSLMTPSMKYTYSCHAYCRPSCTYAWRADKGPWVGGPGNVVSVSPKADDKFKILTCKATNTVSGLYVTASENIAVVAGPSEIQIKGPELIDIGQKYRFECTCECLPSCQYAMSMGSHTVRGKVVDITVDHPQKSVTVTCKAENTASKKTTSASRTIQVKGLNSSTRPEETSAVLLVAFIISAVFML